MKYDNNSVFIITYDKDTAETLKKNGLQCVDNKIPNAYAFVNIDSSVYLHNVDKSKIKYSNLWCV